MTADQRPGSSGASKDKEEIAAQTALFAFVADSVEETGVVNYMFMFKTEMPEHELGEVIDKIPHKFAWLQTVEDPKDSRDAHIYVFEAGKGQIASIPIYPEGALRWSGIVQHVPDCIILTDQESFGKLSQACESAGIDLQSYRHNGTLRTSYES
jgi:hypothetical protein